MLHNRFFYLSHCSNGEVQFFLSLSFTIAQVCLYVFYNIVLSLTVLHCCSVPELASLLNSLLLTDNLAKHSRSTGVSPLVSLRTRRMNLRNKSLQDWRDYVHIADNKPSDYRMSVKYPVPRRDPPYWLSFPRKLQARVAQLLTGRAVTQDFLHIIDKEKYSYE